MSATSLRPPFDTHTILFCFSMIFEILDFELIMQVLFFTLPKSASDVFARIILICKDDDAT